MPDVPLKILCFALGIGPLGCPWEGWLVTILIVAALVYMFIKARRREGAGVAGVSRGRFRVFKDARGEFRFNLVAPNNEVIAVSEGYKAKSGCMKGIDAVRRYAMSDEGEFRIARDRRGEYRFTLLAPNREVIVRSEGYTTRPSCRNGIEAVKRYARDAEIRDDA